MHIKPRQKGYELSQNMYILGDYIRTWHDIQYAYDFCDYKRVIL